MRNVHTITAVLLLALLFVPVAGCKTATGGDREFDLDQAIAYTQLTLEIAQQGLTLYQLEMLSAGQPVDAVEVELWKKRIQFLRDQLTELMAVRVAQQPAAAIK